MVNTIYDAEAVHALHLQEPWSPKSGSKLAMGKTGTSAEDPHGRFCHLMRAASGRGLTINHMPWPGMHDQVAAPTD